MVVDIPSFVTGTPSFFAEVIPSFCLQIQESALFSPFVKTNKQTPQLNKARAIL